MMAQKVLKDKGLWRSLAVIQDPETAESVCLDRHCSRYSDYLGTIEGIADYIIQIAQQKKLINHKKMNMTLIKIATGLLRNGTLGVAIFSLKY
jgi:2-phosphoglycerate kinase